MNENKDPIAEKLQTWKHSRQPKNVNPLPKVLQSKKFNKDKDVKIVGQTTNLRKKSQTGILSSKESNKKQEEEKALSMRERLEKWREEKGRNKPDTVNPLLSRKRPLVGYDYNPKLSKKIKTDGTKKEVEKKQVKTMKLDGQRDKDNRGEAVDGNMEHQQGNSGGAGAEERGTNVTILEKGAADDMGAVVTDDRIDLSTVGSMRMASFCHATPKPNALPRQQIKDTPVQPGILKSSRRMATPRNRKSAISFTPQIRNRISSDTKKSILRSAPQRRSTSTIKYHKMQLTPHPRKIDTLQENSVLKSAPSRRSFAACSRPQWRDTPRLDGHQESKDTPARSAVRLTTKPISGKPRRRHTIHFTDHKDTPLGIEPFTPRGEWQNKNLSIRERLDIWLSVRGPIVKRPFVVQHKTPSRKRTKSGEDETVDLNTTFTLEVEEVSDAENDKQVKDEHTVPNMNKIERAVLEESLKQILVRIDEDTEIETLKDELDLILSTSPGVVRLSTYWIARARVSARSDSIERVICLLEQANAYNAEPEEMIREEICLYLEKLKQDVTNDEGTAANLQEAKPTRTPGKRVKFIDTQQHLAFNSSLIKFCLLECTPFRKRLKSTLAKQIVTPVRRSGRIDKVESKLPSILRSHVPTMASPSELKKDLKDGEIFYLPNLNVDSKWNDIWNKEQDNHEEEQADNAHEISF